MSWMLSTDFSPKISLENSYIGQVIGLLQLLQHQLLEVPEQILEVLEYFGDVVEFLIINQQLDDFHDLIIKIYTYSFLLN